MMKKGTRRLAVLFHEGDRYLATNRYIVHHLAEFWREDGHDVQFIFGPSRFEPADLLFVHINLSVVPEYYLTFARRYPVVLNGGVADIRKSAISSQVLRPGDDWAGPVIVKTDLNCAGVAERLLNRSWLQRRFHTAGLRRLVEGWLGRVTPFRTPFDYEIFERMADVPGSHFSNPDLIVEKFVPETEDGLFFIRIYQFLGDRWSCTRLGSPDPIVKANNSVRVEGIEPHEEVLEWRRRLGMDYGKLDYVIHEGEPVLLDVNKTVGASSYEDAGDRFDERRIREGRRALSQGIYDYL
jgi:hypothetical protein